jgi:DNA topoisomerase-2
MAAALDATYQKLDQREQVLLRPDTHVGACTRAEPTLQYVYNAATRAIERRAIAYVPALLTIFNEILCNAADRAQAGARTIKVTIERAGTLSVYNDGPSIPLDAHPTHKILIPELLFGHLNTSTNYDDAVKRTTGGRNGFGAKALNIFARHFLLEVRHKGKLYTQVFEDNMSKIGAPRITQAPAKKSGDLANDFVRVTARVDLARFGMRELDDDIVALMSRRVIDVSACNPAVSVYLDGRLVPVRSLEAYARCCLGERTVFPAAAADDDDEAAPTTTATTTTTTTATTTSAEKAPKKKMVCAQLDARWSVVVCASDDDAFEHVSFVNSLCTTRGGTHVRLITDRLVKALEDVSAAKASKKEAPPKGAQIRNQLCIFVNCLIENPAFDGQTKEFMTSLAKDFGSVPKMDDAFVKRVAACGVMEAAARYAALKSDMALSKMGGSVAKNKRRLTGLPKLDDANEAGGKRASECTLILTEGDSAKALAVAGLGVIGRDLYGVFPLRGKLLNVREATAKQEAENVEILAVRRILGLEHKKKYDAASVKALRYGKILIMTDQDFDGSHIKGLIINFVHYYFPELLRVPNFMQFFVTPIVKTKRGTGAGARVETFYTLPQYEAWKANNSNGAGWTPKYYKGLGTSTAAEAKEYFSDLPKHRISYAYAGPQDDEAIRLAFEKKRADDRKTWLASIDPLTTFADYSKPTLSYNAFVNRELVLFSHADCTRSIPSLLDGLKPGQRKIMYACFKRNLVAEIKVAQLAGYVSETAAYHHGEASLMSTIINLAQDYVGSNNLNLLYPSGQFGTRLKGGRDAASSRYIFSRLSVLARLIFHPDDDALLEYLDDDGQSIEPRHYVPVLPMALVNGVDGIGTGWSSVIPCYSERALIARVRARLAGSKLAPIAPWYRGFTGTIEIEAADAPPKGRKRARDNTESGDESDDLGSDAALVAEASAVVASAVAAAQATIAAAAPVPAPAPERATQRYIVRGRYTYDAARDPTRLEITELPLHVWTERYKEFLETMVEGDAEKNVPSFVSDFNEFHDDVHVHFVVTLRPEGVALVKREGVEAAFKLAGSLTTSNMVLFDGTGALKRYDSVDEIFEEFVVARFALYKRRRLYLIAEREREFTLADNKARFVRAIVESTLTISGIDNAALAALLDERKFARFPKKAGSAADGGETDAALSDFDYLLSMRLTSLTKERVAKLEQERAAKETDLVRLRASTARSLWLDDLAALERGLDALEKEERAAADKTNAVVDASRKRKAPAAKEKSAKK